MPEELPDRLEPGTLNVPGYAGLREGLRYVRNATPEKLLAREQGLLKRCVRGLEKAGMQVFSGEHQAAAVSFRAGLGCEETAALLARRGITVRAGFHCAPRAHESAGTLETGTVRVSVGYDTFEEEITTFIGAAWKLPPYSL